MSFFTWHYTQGLKKYLKRYVHFLGYIVHYFSLTLLLKTFFAPWKKMTIEDSVGFNISKFFQKITFNLVSRGVGATVRFFLFLTGILVFLISLVLGFAGLLLIIIFPFVTYGKFQNGQKLPKVFVSKLAQKIKDNPSDAGKIVFFSDAGKFILNHLGVDITDLLSIFSSDTNSLSLLNPNSFEDVLKWLTGLRSDTDELLRKKGISKDDFLFSAKWWDLKEARRIKEASKSLKYGKPGIGLELVFGYTPILNKCSEDLSFKRKFSHFLVGREELVSRIERVLSTNKNVLLIGPPGVGKKTVVLEFAKRADSGDLGKEMSYKRVLELDYQLILSTSEDINVKKTRLSNVLNEAASAGNIVLMIKDLHRLTNVDVEGYDFTDVFSQALENRKLDIIAVVSSFEYERFLSKDSRLTKYFEAVEVVPPSKDIAMEILMNAAEDIEKKSKIIITFPALRGILDGSDRYITEIPFPEKTLDLLDAVVTYRLSKGGPVIVDDVSQVLSEKTGISFAVLTEKEKEKLSNLEQIIHEKMINQEAAISLIAQSLRGRAVGVKNDSRPVGSFLFLGPTGVGKTQTAKALAWVYYGSEENILRFDMAEYIGMEGVSRLIGSSINNQPGELTTAIKNHPASLVLFDEIEKSPPEIFNLFLTLLDEGYIVDAFGKKISCRHTFVIATSNAGGEYIRELVMENIKGQELQSKVLEYIQKNRLFSPEFLNRFDGVVVYEPLKKEDLTKVAVLLLNDFQKSLLQKNIYMEYDENVCKKIAEEGYDPSLGARPMRRIVDLTLSDLLGKAILQGKIINGDKIKIKAGEIKNEYLWEKTHKTGDTSS